jgi:hypothetical protein
MFLDVKHMSNMSHKPKGLGRDNFVETKKDRSAVEASGFKNSVFNACEKPEATVAHFPAHSDRASQIS